MKSLSYRGTYFGRVGHDRRPTPPTPPDFEPRKAFALMSPPVNDRPPTRPRPLVGRPAILGRHLWPKGETGLRGRVVVALALLVLAKLTNVYVPILYKHAVDALGEQRPRPWRCRSR